MTVWLDPRTRGVVADAMRAVAAERGLDAIPVEAAMVAERVAEVLLAEIERLRGRVEHHEGERPAWRPVMLSDRMTYDDD